ncbi:hypothetical protein GUI37_01585 [Helcococcus kunzii]|uniref:hypothetical protein n=1 Tax=Helcococcus kunzii TaxID=40091 RepID=UPI001BAF5D01|nr:hypothetical protein [Helcococcus kunzii]QUY64278.1 hypothetical protein GUI37_01585 [Helcococcus kunzii]
MNKKQAIECLEVHAEELKRRGFEDVHLRQVMEHLQQPISLAEFLGWEEGVEYEEVYGDRFIIEDDSLYKTYDTSFDDGYKTSRTTGFDWSVGNIEWLRKAKKVEPKQKLKAYHVKDDYSYNCLMKELEEQGYMWGFYKKATELDAWRDYEEEIIIYCTNEKKLRFSDLAYYKDKEKDNYDLVKYHKEEPLHYAKIKGTEIYMNDIDYTWGGFTTIEGRAIQMAKTDWNKLGINDTNADFEEVD